jgi:Uma2 family endonuclease
METLTDLGDPPLVLQLQPVLELSDEQFFELAQLNRDLRMELTARGELILALPTGGETGQRNSEITMQLALWAKRDGRGTTFDSSTGFRLPNGAVRSPDASWVAKARLAALSDEQRQKFLPLCPDFVIELRSPTDRLTVLREKMQEYLDNGAQLGLLLDPEQRRVYVYRAGAEVEELTGAETISAEPVLPGFALDLREIW